MDEGIAIRAITIGASVLIAIATMSAVMAYYNVAKEMVVSIGPGTDLAGNYTKSIEATLLKSNINGVDVKNLLNYFYGNAEVNITIKGIKLRVSYDSISEFHALYGEPLGNINNDKSKDYKLNNILRYILPNQNFTLTHSDNSGILDVVITENK